MEIPSDVSKISEPIRRHSKIVLSTAVGCLGSVPSCLACQGSQARGLTCWTRLCGRLQPWAAGWDFIPDPDPWELNHHKGTLNVSHFRRAAYCCLLKGVPPSCTHTSFNSLLTLCVALI